MRNGRYILKVAPLCLLIVLASSCVPRRQAYDHTGGVQRAYDISVFEIGGFRLGMTPRAAKSVIMQKGYRESSSNLETLEDLSSKRLTRESRIEIFEHAHGETLDDVLLKETGTFYLGFSPFSDGRIYTIEYGLQNVPTNRLDALRRKNEQALPSATVRKTQQIKGAKWVTWQSESNVYPKIWVHYIERSPWFASPQLGGDGIDKCEYRVVVFDRFR